MWQITLFLSAVGSSERKQQQNKKKKERKKNKSASALQKQNIFQTSEDIKPNNKNPTACLFRISCLRVIINLIKED